MLNIIIPSAAFFVNCFLQVMRLLTSNDTAFCFYPLEAQKINKISQHFFFKCAILIAV